LALHGRLLKSTRAPGLLRRDVQPLLASIKAEEGINIEDELEPLLEVAESLRVYIKALDSKLEKYAASNEVCRLLMSMPGVGAICALSFYSAIEDPTRFRSATDVGAYLGLTPRRHQSGNASRVRGITKTGSKLTRTHLFIAATVFGTRAPECALKTWYLALRDRAGHRRARVALARKLAIVLLSMWKSRTGFDVVRRSLIEGAAGS
jgi:transposase